MDKKAGIVDTVTSAAPYGMMWYGNTLAAPQSFERDERGRQRHPDDIKKLRLRHLMKGLAYAGGGNAATRLAFPEDFQREKPQQGYLSSLRDKAIGFAASKGVPDFLLPKTAAFLIRCAVSQEK